MKATKVIKQLQNIIDKEQCDFEVMFSNHEGDYYIDKIYLSNFDIIKLEENE